MSSLLIAAALLSTPTIDLPGEARRLLVLADVSVQALRTPSTPQTSALIDVDLGGLPFTLDVWPHSLRAHGYQLLEDTGGGNLRVLIDR